MSFKIDFDLFLSHINNAFNSHINNYLFFNKNNLNRFGKVVPITYSRYDDNNNENNENDNNNNNNNNNNNDENDKENKINRNEEHQIKINNEFLNYLYEKYKFNYDLETGLNDIELGQFDNR